MLYAFSSSRHPGLRSGVHGFGYRFGSFGPWIPAFAGMTSSGKKSSQLSALSFSLSASSVTLDADSVSMACVSFVISATFQEPRIHPRPKICLVCRDFSYRKGKDRRFWVSLPRRFGSNDVAKKCHQRIWGMSESGESDLHGFHRFGDNAQRQEHRKWLRFFQREKSELFIKGDRLFFRQEIEPGASGDL